MKVSTVQQRIATKARNEPELCFTALNHYLDLDWLYEAYRRVRKDVVPGVDGVTAQQYEVNLDNNLRSLQDRLKSGRYIAPPVKRVHIPKDDGSGATRPIGLPAFEDKIAQRAVVMLLSPIYEQDFLPCSHGFREKRSAHQALGSLRNQIMDKSTWWILEVDIKSYFDSLVFKRLRAFLDHRVRDGVVRRLINKWLKAGVVERTQISYPTEGTSQGGVLSPLLSNIYLHYVLDEWFKDEVKPRLKGKAFLVRYADDFVLGFQLQSDAERVLEVLPKRFGKYGLRLHPDKTRMVAFGRPPRDQKRKPRGGGPASFDFLGFTHYWGRSMKGNWVVKQKTARKRYTRSLIRIREWLRRGSSGWGRFGGRKLATRL